MSKRIELLAPGGDIDSIKAAIIAGADAIYCGLDKFNARNRATNINFDALQGILRLAHNHNCHVFLTLNIIITENEIPALLSVLNKLVNTSIDGIIIQDIGMMYLVSKYFKSLKIHASTQLTTHNEGQILLLKKLSTERVNLSRELNISEIKNLTNLAHQTDMMIEVFVHGSYCICFSGICYISSVHGGNSGNRGRCSQPCRDQYLTTSTGKNFPLNLKDNAAFTDLDLLNDAGVDSLKIEGRIKKFHYVFTVVDAWRQQLERMYSNTQLVTNKAPLYKVFNRDFSNDFLKGSISKNMFIDNPRDNSAIHYSENNESFSLDNSKAAVYDERTEIINSVQDKIDQLSTAKVALQIHISGTCGLPMKVSVTSPDLSFDVFSDISLANVSTQSLSYDILFSRLKYINDTEYFIVNIDISNLQETVFLPFKELTAIKNKILFQLLGSRAYIEPIELPALTSDKNIDSKPSLSILISSFDDVYLSQENAKVYFQIPSCFNDDRDTYINLFTQNRNLIPLFPSILIGDNYTTAVSLLEKVQPPCIVTNNLGIAYEAFKMGIMWIAGPFLNIVNSYSLLCLKEQFNCSGAFISNELNKVQIKAIKKPKDFQLYFSIYHPITLMTSRQCLFHQVTGCNKTVIDDSCLTQCYKTASITNLKQESFVIEKSKGNYHNIYAEFNYLNTEIISDIPNVFSEYLIDLRDIVTSTKSTAKKTELISQFEYVMNNKPIAVEELKKMIQPTTNRQYRKGL